MPSCRMYVICVQIRLARFTWYDCCWGENHSYLLLAVISVYFTLDSWLVGQHSWWNCWASKFYCNTVLDGIIKYFYVKYPAAVVIAFSVNDIMHSYFLIYRSSVIFFNVNYACHMAMWFIFLIKKVLCWKCSVILSPWAPLNAFEETIISQKLYHISVRFSVNDIMRTDPLISTSCVTFCHVNFASDVGPLIELTKTLPVLYCFPICGTYKLKETKKSELSKPQDICMYM